MVVVRPTAAHPPSAMAFASVMARRRSRIDAYEAENNPNKLLPGAPRFIDYAWKKFDAKKNLELLVSEQQTYEALKPILFSGVCTWVVCPDRNSLRQHGMLLVGIEHMRAAEALGRDTFKDRDVPNHDLLGDIMGRLRALGHDFYSDFYYPVGGLAQVLRSTTPGTFAKSLAKHTAEVHIAVAMMQVYDLNTKIEKGNDVWHKSSESKGFEIFR